jgi:hypothetical protein
MRLLKRFGVACSRTAIDRAWRGAWRLDRAAASASPCGAGRGVSRRGGSGANDGAKDRAEGGEVVGLELAEGTDDEGALDGGDDRLHDLADMAGGPQRG